MKNKTVIFMLLSCMLHVVMMGACGRMGSSNRSASDNTAKTGSDVEMAKSGEDTASDACKVPQTGTWQLKKTTGKKYIILGTDDDNIGNPKFFRLLRTYNFPYTMNTEAENVSKIKALGSDVDETLFTSEDAPALFPNGVDIVTLGKYLYENNLGEVAQHGASNKTLWDSEKLTGDFLTSVHTNYVEQGGTKSEEELRLAIMEYLSDTDGSQGASYVSSSRVCLEEAYGFPIYTVGIWGGAPVAVIDGIECSLNRIKGVSNFDWRAENYLSVGSVLGSYKKNKSLYDLPRIICGVDDVASYIEKIEPGKACEFFWHMPFHDEPDISKWRALFDYIKSLVDDGKAEVVTRRQYAELGEWVENPITKISIDRAEISLGEDDSDHAYTITATYADNSTADVSDEAILDRSAVNTEVGGTYNISATYRGFSSTATVMVNEGNPVSGAGSSAGKEEFIEKEEVQGIGFHILSEEDSYVYGYYKHWGGEFADAAEAICATEFVAVSEKAYYYYTNDPRVVVTIQQYDKDKKWISPKKEYRKLVRGTRVVLEDNTEYLSITLRSSVWGIDVKGLFECGLVVGFVSEEPDFSVDTTALSPKSWQDLSIWQRGRYSETTGQLLLGDDGLSLKAYYETVPGKYLVSLPARDWELRILELAEDDRILHLKKLVNSEIWNPDKETRKIAVTLVSTDKETTAGQLEEVLKQFGTALLEVYRDDNYNKEMRTLTATEFMQEMNIGWNLGNSLDCKMKERGLDANVKQELAWFNPYVEKSLIDYVAEQGFNTIRIPVTWYYNTEVDEFGNLVIGEAFLTRVKQVVNYAIENDLYVILNSHHDEEMIYAGVDDAAMEQVYKDAEALWTQIANYFKDYDEHLIFEAYNEVDNRELSWTFGEKAAAQANRLNQIFVDTVRSTGGNNENRILMVPTLIDKYNEQMLKAFVVPEDTAKDRLIVLVHAYSKAFSQAIEKDFILMERYSRQWGIPIVIGEFGTTTKYFEPSLRTVHATNYVARAAAHGIKCIWWDNGGDFKIIDRMDYSKSNKELIDALFLGLAGKKCDLKNEILLGTPKDYADGTVKDKELVVNRFWGAITTDRNGEAIAIPEGSKCMLSLTAQGETSDVWMGGVAFYNKNGEVLPVTTNNVSATTTTVKALFWTCDVPEGACYIRVSMYNPFISISRETFDRSLEEGKLELSVSVFNPEDVILN